MSYEKVLVCPLLRSVLGVLGHRAWTLLRWCLQHYYLGLAVASRVVGTWHGSSDMGLVKNIEELN